MSKSIFLIVGFVAFLPSAYAETHAAVGQSTVFRADKNGDRLITLQRQINSLSKELSEKDGNLFYPPGTQPDFRKHLENLKTHLANLGDDPLLRSIEADSIEAELLYIRKQAEIMAGFKKDFQKLVTKDDAYWKELAKANLKERFGEAADDLPPFILENEASNLKESLVQSFIEPARILALEALSKDAGFNQLRKNARVKKTEKHFIDNTTGEKLNVKEGSALKAALSQRNELIVSPSAQQLEYAADHVASNDALPKKLEHLTKEQYKHHIAQAIAFAMRANSLNQ